MLHSLIEMSPGQAFVGCFAARDHQFGPEAISELAVPRMELHDVDAKQGSFPPPRGALDLADRELKLAAGRRRDRLDIF